MDIIYYYIQESSNSLHVRMNRRDTPDFVHELI